MGNKPIKMGSKPIKLCSFVMTRFMGIKIGINLPVEKTELMK